MDITREFTAEGEVLKMHYNSSERIKDEMGITEVFPFYKISIILTDGLEAQFTSGSSRVLKTGEIMVFSPYQAHYGRFLRSGHFEYMDFYLPVGYVESKTLLRFLAGTQESFAVNGEGFMEMLYSMADACVEGDSDMLGAYFTVLTHLIKRLYLRRAGENNSKAPEIIRQAIEYISREFVSISTVGQIAEVCACSEKHLTRLFKRQMGLTAYEYLIKTKLNNAKGILLSGGSVTSACYDSGFTDYSHFIQLFKKNYGITPNKYKRS